ncbi:MAG: tRNA dihydrouridine synthase [Candidatus Helarchaeota archaeon]
MRIKNLTLVNRTLLAPLTGVSNHKFRILCRHYRAALVFTEKFNINALVNVFPKYHSALEIAPKERPISVQVIGNDPKIMRKAMELLESYNYDAYDLNLGCPSPAALRDGIGAALLKTPEKIPPLLKVMLNSTNKPVSAKIRIGFDFNSINALEIAKLIENEGADFITIHGRTVREQYSSITNLAIIKKIKEMLTIPVVGNGDIMDGPSAKHMLDYTKCDLLMIGRAAIDNPRVFLDINNYLNTKKTDL